MCLPTGLAIASGLFSAAGSVMQGQQQAAMYEAQAKIAENNARLAEKASEEELRKSAREEHRLRQEARQFQGTQRATLAGSGAQLSGSPLSVLADTGMGIEQDAEMLRYNGLQKWWGRGVEATNFRNEANAAHSAASNARTSGWWGGFTSLLNTGISVAGMNAGPPQGAQISGGNINLPQAKRNAQGMTPKQAQAAAYENNYRQWYARRFAPN